MADGTSGSVSLPMSEDVRAYYESFGQREWERLDDGAVEFIVTLRAIESYLPAGAGVLDIGGGPGRYSLWLAERGHHVVLADLSPRLIAIARDRITASRASDFIDDIVIAAFPP
jgi:2-polyprenyl-3-methyl-5-hydroxy-6-metoxy-1,4-benzoquinol methylase